MLLNSAEKLQDKVLFCRNITEQDCHTVQKCHNKGETIRWKIHGTEIMEDRKTTRCNDYYTMGDQKRNLRPKLM